MPQPKVSTRPGQIETPPTRYDQSLLIPAVETVVREVVVDPCCMPPEEPAPAPNAWTVPPVDMTDGAVELSGLTEDPFTSGDLIVWNMEHLDSRFATHPTRAGEVDLWTVPDANTFRSSVVADGVLFQGGSGGRFMIDRDAPYSPISSPSVPECQWLVFDLLGMHQTASNSTRFMVGLMAWDDSSSPGNYVAHTGANCAVEQGGWRWKFGGTSWILVGAPDRSAVSRTHMVGWHRDANQKMRFYAGGSGGDLFNYYDGSASASLPTSPNRRGVYIESPTVPGISIVKLKSWRRNVGATASFFR